MELVTLTAGDLETTFAPEANMVCSSLRHRGEELLGQRRGLEAYARSGSTMGIPLLYPWANRLAAPRFEVLGRTVDLDLAPGRWRPDGETGLPIHGLLGGARGWRVEHRAERALAASFDWAAHEDLLAAFPFPHRLVLVAELDEQALRLTVRVEPADEQPVPVALGFHPYLRLPGDVRADWRVRLPVRRRLVLDERKLPTGETEQVEPWEGPLRDTALDEGFDRLEGEPPTFVLAGEHRTIAVAFERGFPCAQAFAPASDEVVAFEPMTAPTDALVSGRELPVAPHEAIFAITVR